MTHQWSRNWEATGSKQTPANPTQPQARKVDQRCSSLSCSHILPAINWTQRTCDPWHTTSSSNNGWWWPQLFSSWRSFCLLHSWRWVYCRNRQNFLLLALRHNLGTLPIFEWLSELNSKNASTISGTLKAIWTFYLLMKCNFFPFVCCCCSLPKYSLCTYITNTMQEINKQKFRFDLLTKEWNALCWLCFARDLWISNQLCEQQCLPDVSRTLNTSWEKWTLIRPIAWSWSPPSMRPDHGLRTAYCLIA